MILVLPEFLQIKYVTSKGSIQPTHDQIEESSAKDWWSWLHGRDGDKQQLLWEK